MVGWYLVWWGWYPPIQWSAVLRVLGSIQEEPRQTHRMGWYSKPCIVVCGVESLGVQGATPITILEPILQTTTTTLHLSLWQGRGEGGGGGALGIRVGYQPHNKGSKGVIHARKQYLACGTQFRCIPSKHPSALEQTQRRKSS